MKTLIARLGLLMAPLAGSAEELSFSRDIRPILSNQCFFCHGPDSAKREAGLRLDTFDGATAVLEESKGRAIVPGDTAASLLVRRIRATDPAEVMPPPKSHLKLTSKEIGLLERWVREGAKYEQHWAFIPLPATVPVPALEAGAVAHNEIDHFVLARLKQENLSPSAEAVPLRMLRRASFDLNGLPPTPAEVVGFNPSSYESAVDKMLASPRFGEALALDWLDAARYADSYGYQSDLLSHQWPWRDWVIRAFNENLSYDQFATWQIAGDLLPNATPDQKLATAFNRLHRMTQEGGSIHEEMRIEGVSDRVHTFGTAFLGLTMECARCHDHKYDPITARDYYSLGGFFNSIPERGVYADGVIPPGPALLLPTPDQEKTIGQARLKVDAALANWQARLANPPAESAAVRPDQVADFQFEAGSGAEVSPNLFPGAAPEARFPGLLTTTGPSGQAVVLDGDHGITIPGLLVGDWPQPWTVDLGVRDTVANPEAIVLWHRTFGTDAGYNGIECLLGGGKIEVRLARDWPGSAVGAITVPVLEKNRWQRISVTWDGSGTAAGIAIYLDGVPQRVTPTADRLRQSITTKSYGDGDFTIGARFRDRGFRGGEIDGLRVFHRALAPPEIKELDQSGSHTGVPINPDVFAAAEREALRRARQEWVDAESGVKSVAVMAELDTARPAWILPHGLYSAPRTAENEVSRDTFSQILPRFPEGVPRDRLGLARWLMQPDHPLTSRVFVNRVWQHFFGNGLVSTPDNFGFQGSAPSHPELLDWLARDFIAHGWDIKRLCRQIVFSATYRQDSAMRPELLERDPTNQLLARGPSRRLGAESIRDLALASSGTLITRSGGPPVSPYQPGADLWRESNSMSPAYHRSSGEDLYRRSIYSVWKRTAPLPNALLFDAPGREACVVKRSNTNTPLQALALLNDPQFVEPSRALASQLLRDHPTDLQARIREAFISLAGRPPDPREQDLLERLIVSQTGFFEGQPKATQAFLEIGETPAEPALDPVQLAATTVMCQTILNLDAVIWNR